MSSCQATSGEILAGSKETIFLHSLFIAPGTSQVEDATVNYSINSVDDGSQVMSGLLEWDGTVTTDPETGEAINGAYISYDEDTTPLTKGAMYEITYTANGSVVPAEDGKGSRIIEAV